MVCKSSIEYAPLPSDREGVSYSHVTTCETMPNIEVRGIVDLRALAFLCSGGMAFRMDLCL